MLKLPGRGERGLRSSFLSHYKNIYETIKSRTETRDSIKQEVLNLDIGTRNTQNIQLQNIEKSFGKQFSLKNINLNIEAGKVFGIIGESGSGKTTLLRLIIGFYKPDKGNIIYSQKDVRKQLKRISMDFGFATQNNSFYSDLTAEENIKFFGILYGLKNKELKDRTEQVLRVVELYDARKMLAEKLSGGMQRRLDLACAMVNNPKVLILDEPTEDLDPNLRHELLRLIKKINLNGTTIIFTTHLINEAEFLCDKVAILSKGEILASGSVIDLKNMYKDEEEIHIVLQDNKSYSRYLKRLKPFRSSISDNALIIHIPRKYKAISVFKKVLGWIERDNEKIISANIRKPSLNQVFSGLLKNAKRSKR